MQNLKKYHLKSKTLVLIGLVFIALFSSCEDVVNLDLETGQERMVVDAEIIWKKGTTGSEQVIKVSKTAPYYNNTTPKVSGAQVRVENSTGDVFTFNEKEPGLYVCTNFVPVLDMDYTLFVQAEGQSFKAVEKLTSVPPIDRVEQKMTPDIAGDDLLEVTFYYKDPADQVNYYLADHKSDFLLFPDYTLLSDEFFNGNEMSIRYSDTDLKPGKTLVITNRGISKNFYNYMGLLLEIYGGSPFSIPPGNIRGNVISVNDPNNYAMGYFRLCEADTVTYTAK